MERLPFYTGVLMEEWRPIEGYEDLYEVSNYGRVRSFDRIAVRYSNGGTQVRRGRILALVLDRPEGYHRVLLCRNGNQKSHYVHRLVAQSFIPNPEKKPFVNHKDGDKTNNHVDNLEWCTQLENVQHAISTGLTKNKGSESPSAKAIVTCRGDKFGSAIEAAEYFGMANHRNISKVLKGFRKHAGRYPDGVKIGWKYLDVPIDKKNEPV